MLIRKIILLLGVFGFLLLPALMAQTVTTGDVGGVVTDTSGAVVQNATVTLKNIATEESRTVQTSSVGAYRFSFMKPGTYELSAAAPDLNSDVMRNVVVAVGKILNMNLTLKVKGQSTVVEVTENASLLQTENANIASTISLKQITLTPLPGGDITTVAFTVPGVVVSTGSGYGAFSSQGLPGTSNLFTMNGNDNMDPYMNLNNSGASNLTLGQNEIQEASVVQNAYSAQYGRQAGAQINYITRSGSNQFHGNLLYNYNGTVLNANDFFANASGTPRGHAVSNQYAASIGGPVVKDKLFFFVDTEGLRYSLPTTGTVSVPSQALQDYVLGKVTAAQRPFYQTMFNLYNAAPGIERAVAVTNGDGLFQDSNGSLGCGTLTGTPTTGGVFGVNVGCARAFGTNVSGANKEWLLASRVDWNVNSDHRLFFRFRTDHGLQPTETSPISPIFNSVSNQPQYEGQLTHTWVISPRMVNNFIGSGSWYSAIFGPPDLNASLSAFPMQILINDGGANGTGGFSQMGLTNTTFPQGRRVGQAQLLDDLSYITGKHALRVGINYRYNRVADTGNQRLVYGGEYSLNGLDEFANGAIDSTTGSFYTQRFTPFPVVHLRLYNLGFYLQDEWALLTNLKLTLAVRFDRTGNPTCSDNCFSRLNLPFQTSNKGISIPYNQSITTGLSNAFYEIEPISPQPRFGFAYNPKWSKGTVIRGGIGLFTDLYPASVTSGLFGNSPNVYTPTVRLGTINSGGAGSSPAVAIATGSAFQSGFASGATLAQLQATLAPILNLSPASAFTPPPYYSIPNKLQNPQYLEWSLEIERQLFSPNNVLTLSYAGNHGRNIFVRNMKANASYTASAYPNGFDGLPSVAPDTRFRIVTALTNDGFSNYNGLSISFRRGFVKGFQGKFGYTWSHGLDTISNGGLTLFYSGDSLTNQLHPSDLRSLNYSNSDYDIRHNFSADFIWEIPANFSNHIAKSILSGWSLGTKVYARTGTPFSVFNSRIPGRLSASTGGTVLASVLDSGINKSCGSSAVDTPCFTASQFATYTEQTNFGNLPRNSFRGPGYVDIDSMLQKTIRLGDKAQFSFGATALNLFNHPNFGSPGQNVGVGGVGIISTTVIPPSSPYGSFQGSAVSGRVVVVSGRFSF